MQRTVAFSKRHTFLVLVLPAYVALTALFTYPLVPNLHRMVVGLNVDSEAYMWSFWWMRQAVVNLHTNPYFSNWIYYPEGTSLYFYGHNVVREFLAIPFQSLFGLIVAYNVTALLGFVASACTAYWLGWEVTGRRRAGFVAGVVFAFAPTQVFHFNVGQPNLHAVEFVPLYILCLLRWLNGGGVRWLLGAAIAMTLSSLSDWQLPVYLQLFTGVALVAALLHGGAAQWRERVWQLGWRTAALEGLYALAIAPVLVPMLLEASSGRSYMFRGRHDTIYHSSDLLAFLVPNPQHPWWGAATSELFHALNTPGILVTVVSLSYVALTLAALALWRAWRVARFWLVGGVVFGLLALGPALRVLGIQTSIPLPYEILFQIPILRVSRAPARYAIITVLCLSVLAAIGTRLLIEALEQRSAAHGGRGVLLSRGGFALLVGVLCFELLPVPVNASYPATPPPFLTDGTLAGAGALMEIPNPSNRGMYYATIHEKPVLYAELSRDNPPGPVLEYLREDVFDTENEIIDAATGWRCVTRYYNFTHILLYHREHLADLREQQIVAHLGQDALLRESPELSLYRFPDAPVNETCLIIGEGWGRPRAPHGEQASYRWMEQQGRIAVLRKRPGRVVFRFDAHSFAVPRTVQVSLDGGMIGELSVGKPRSFTLDAEVGAGLHWLELRSVEPASNPAEYGYPDEEEPVISIGLSRLRVAPE